MQPLMREQPPLAFQAAPESGERTVGADDTMTGHDDADRISAVRQSDRARGAGIADALRLLAVAQGLAIANLRQALPHTLLKLRALQVERQVELAARSREILLEL